MRAQGADAVEAAATTHSVAAVEAAADEFVQPLVHVVAELRRQYCERAMQANTQYVQDSSQRLAKLLLLQVLLLLLLLPLPPPPLLLLMLISQRQHALGKRHALLSACETPLNAAETAPVLHLMCDDADAGTSKHSRIHPGRCDRYRVQATGIQY